MSSASPSPPKIQRAKNAPRRPWSFRLRTMFLILTACGVVFVWFDRNFEGPRRRIESLPPGGWVTFTNSADSSGGFEAFLRRHLPRAYFDRVLRVDLDFGKRDDELAIIEQMPPFTELSLRETQLSDRGWERIARWKSLKSLSLFRLPITEQNLNALARLPELESLWLEELEVSDQLLEPLKRFPALKEVNFYASGLTNHGLAELAKLKSLERLHLINTPIEVLSDDETQTTYKGLAAFAGHPSLCQLSLKDNPFKNDQLPPITRIPLLVRLDLCGTRVSDAGLEQLKTMSRLRELNLTETKVTAEGVARLQAALPDCVIDWP